MKTANLTHRKTSRKIGLVGRIRKNIVSTIRQKRFVRYSLIGLNIVLLTGAIVFVAQSSPAVLTTTGANSEVAANPLDELSSAEIAVSLSQVTNLPETTAVINQADSVNTELAVPVAGTAVIAKPQIVGTSLKSRNDIVNYTVASGDTVSSVAAKFGVTSDSVRWSNGLTGDSLTPGSNVIVPPINGIVYTVKAGDTPDTLAQKYRASKDQIIAYNDAEIAGLSVGEKIIIPNGQLPVPVVATTAVYGFAWGGSAIYGYNGYDYGFCTWYVANRRAGAGSPVPANLGNASTWDDRAALAGIPVDRNPAVGAAVVTGQVGWGHVAYVERVNSDGSIWVSEMNSSGQVSIDNPAGAGGWGRVDYKLISAGAAHSYAYIH